MIKKVKIASHSISFKVFIYCMTLVLIPIIMISVMTYIISYNIIKDQTNTTESMLLEQFASNVSYKLEQVKMSAVAITSNADVLRDLRTYKYMDIESLELNTRTLATLKSYMMIGNVINDIFIRTYEGKELSFGFSNSMEKEYKRLDPLIEKYKGNSHKWIYAHSKEEKGNGQLSYLTSFNDYYKGGTPMGVLIIDVKKDIFDQVFGELDDGTRGNYFILDSHDQLIYGGNTKSLETLPKHFEFAEGEFEIAQFDNEKYVLSYKTISGTDWKIVSKVAVSEYLLSLKIIQITLMISFFITFIMAIILTVRFSKKLTTPINRLVGEMKEVQQGNFELCHSNYYKNDEIGFLKERFDEMIHRIHQLMNQIYEEENDKRTAEINALQSQMNPHFLYNTLNSVYCLAQINGQVKISGIVSNLSALLRISMNFQNEFVTIESELEYIKKYLEICNIRWGERFQLTRECSKKMQGFFVPKLIIQPLLENSVSHGFVDHEEKGNILLKVVELGDNIRISVIDDGIGMDNDKMLDINQKLCEENSKHNTSIGIYNVNARLKLHFGKEYGLTYTKNEGKGVSATLLIPKREEK